MSFREESRSGARPTLVCLALLGVVSATSQGIGAELTSPIMVAHSSGPQFVKTKVSGVDDRIDSKGDILPKARLTADELRKFNGIGLFLCDSTGLTGTATLVRKDKDHVFIASGHVIIPEKDELKYTPSEMIARFPQYASGCEIIFTDGNGVEVDRYKLDRTRAVPGAFEPTTDPEGDFVVFVATRLKMDNKPPIDLNPLPLVVAPKLSTPVFGRMVAFHHDVMPDGVKIKSEGKVMAFPSTSRFYDSGGSVQPRIVGSDIDTQGWASGAAVLNQQNQIIGIHFGGSIPPGKDADFVSSSNFLIAIRRQIIRLVNEM